MHRTAAVRRLHFHELESRLAPAGFFAAGADAGGGPEVRVFDAETGAALASFQAYDPAFLGGVRVALGDVNADGVADIVTAPGPGGGPHVKVFSGRDLSLLAEFLAYDPSFTGGVTLAVGDVNADAVGEVITGAGAGGVAHVRSFNVLSGTATQIAGPLGNFLAYSASFLGGVNVASGNFDGVGGDEIITGPGPGGGPHVRVFGSDGTAIADVIAYDANFLGGVNVAAGDLNDDRRADIIAGPASNGGPHVQAFDATDGSTLASFLAYDASFTGGVRVSSADFNADNHADIVTGAGPGGGPHQRYFDGQTFEETTGLLAFDASFIGGITVSGATRSTRGDPSLQPFGQEVPAIQRLGRFVPSAVPSLANWTTQSADDTSLDGKHVYVIAHGWAPGYVDMVNAYVSSNLPNPPLKWWQTLDTSLPKSPGFPDSAAMFYGASGDDVQINPVGVAYAITQADPLAVVLAYSWIDESATPTSVGGFPTESYLSEAYTTMNGHRLANAMIAALPSNFSANGGRLHLIGHSHGSKVATVATDVLARTTGTNYHVGHLTILDSPEVDSTLVSRGDAANNLWYFLGGLNTGRSTTTTFVDNYVSEFGSLIGPIQGFNPLDTSDKTASVQEVVDVNLNPSVLFGGTSFSDRHAYAFNWYGGASLQWAQNPTPADGLHWSPLVNPTKTQSLAGSYNQSWTKLTDPQFALTANGTEPSINTVSITPTFTNLALSSTTTTSGASFANNTVTLSQSGGSDPTFTGQFRPTANLDGISFNFRFTNVGAGDQLIISLDTGAFHLYNQTYFVMTGAVAGNAQNYATLSLTSLAGAHSDSTITIQLKTTSGSNASVEVSNMQQFGM